MSWHLPCSLFFLAALLSTVSEHLSTGGFIRTRSDGKLFKLARLKASTKPRELCFHELLFADDAAIVAHSLEDIREICKQFEQAATMFGLTINTKKTVTLYQPPPGQTSIDPHVEIYGTPLKAVKNFTYLGSTVASDNTIDVEIKNRFQAASEAFGGLWKRVWSKHSISVSTECKMYKAMLENSLKCISDIYDKSCRYHGKITFQMLKS